MPQQHGASISGIAGDDLTRAELSRDPRGQPASHRAPRIIELAWGIAAHPHVAICGKGVCFDTGGSGRHTAVGMPQMKKDMGGAAHQLALAGLVMARQLPLRITC